MTLQQYIIQRIFSVLEFLYVEVSAQFLRDILPDFLVVFNDKYFEHNLTPLIYLSGSPTIISE